jgi:peptide-methionine (S)-S-oxide reductase
MLFNKINITITLILSNTIFLSSTQNNLTKKLPNHPNLTEYKKSIQMDSATFGAGCFWCIEAQFALLEGVISVKSGFEGGHVKNPSYKEVCSGTTGHAEVVEVIYNPSKITYVELLAAFWQTHDPTQLNRQGNDIGTQYRSVIFYHNSEQKELAEKYKKKLNSSGAWDKPLVTEISPATFFYKAEDYHQNYFDENSTQPYCQYIIQPKVEKFKKIFKAKMKVH